MFLLFVLLDMWLDIWIYRESLFIYLFISIRDSFENYKMISLSPADIVILAVWEIK